ncbi:MAG: leucyl aminopeptidase [Flavobacteriales bacterium]|nr:leucyl aminopeptidase [Flavobacteriales bacterium]
MNTKISRITSIPSGESLILLGNKRSAWTGYGLNAREVAHARKYLAKGKRELVAIDQLTRKVWLQIIPDKDTVELQHEAVRRAGANLVSAINGDKLSKVTVIDVANNAAATLALVEGLALGNYKFTKYFTNGTAAPALKNIKIFSKKISPADISGLTCVLGGTERARTLVNEPLSFLTAVQLSKEIQRFGKEAGFRVEVLTKTKIEALKMGGLLGVNKGSLDPPTFNIMEWKPRNARNKKPYVLVGKGVVFDTGGLSLKPTPNSMDLMKSDMGGAAAVAGTMYAVSKAKLPVHVIGLIPATDNRPSGNAYVPGDVLTMYDGTTVEVLNTDAEGRLILADALAYAKKYKPELVIDLATLTGAAVAAIGHYGIVSMQEGADKENEQLKKSGHAVHERLAEMPFWSDYDNLIKSSIADIKNLGGPTAGAITAGKFLHRFTQYPWIHLDIAGPAFLGAADGYRSIGGTGVGVRLLFDFFKNK